MRYAMIMAGGSGTRLWPVSRDGQPKQLIEFIPGEVGGTKSLLEIAASRLEGLVEETSRYICTGERYREQIKDALPIFKDDQILGEPMARDTLNAVGLTAAVLAKKDKDAIFAVLTADHLIEPNDVFQERLRLGFELVEQDPKRIVTFSITPTYPATGFGYVERGSAIDSLEQTRVGHKQLAFTVSKFVEKPPLHMAQVYVESGHYGWNAGMFVFHAQSLLDCLVRYQPECHAGLMKIQDAWGTDEQSRVLKKVYPELPKTSIDYAVMEPAAKDPKVRVTTVEMDVKWLDVGSWPSFFETLKADSAGNRKAGAGASYFEQSSGSSIYNTTDGHAVALVGCEGLVVVHTDRATLVMPADKAQELRALREQLPEDLR